MSRWFQALTGVLFAGAFAACGDGTGPTGSVPLSLSFQVAGPGGPSPALMSATYTDADGNMLEITKVEMILREIEFERTEAVLDCDDPAGEDACEEVVTGPELLDLPLAAASPVEAFRTTLPVGSWKEVEFEVHKLDDEDPRDQVITNVRPEFDRISIRVEGTWTPAGGNPVSFLFASDLNEEQEIEFAAPLAVEEGDVKNVTFELDLGGWFRDLSGILFNPAAASWDSGNSDLINLAKDNIRNSIEGFEDDDGDGVED